MKVRHALRGQNMESVTAKEEKPVGDAELNLKPVETLRVEVMCDCIWS